MGIEAAICSFADIWGTNSLWMHVHDVGSEVYWEVKTQKQSRRLTKQLIGKQIFKKTLYTRQTLIKTI